jgi:ssRNA-specific RNase YbeY (16S rRNA maturation enzyme)
MSLVLRNGQRSVKINLPLLRRQIVAIREIVDCAEFDLSVCLTTNQKIRQYNRQLRRVDKPTDVLSLPFIEKLNPGLKPVPIHDDFKVKTHRNPIRGM